MKDRIFKIGDLDVKISDLGLDLDWVDFETKEIRHTWMNQPGLEELIKRVQMNDYQYKAYLKKLDRTRKLKKISNEPNINNI
jgi:hypothetical protein